MIEIHETNNLLLNDNKFRLRIEKNINKSKPQTSNHKESFCPKEDTIIKNFYANDGSYIFNVFKKYFSHHYSNDKLYECNLNLPIGEYGSKMLQMVNLPVL